MKDIYRAKAIQLRKNGHSYNEIQKTVPVSKSTLSKWLKSINLSPNQKKRIEILGNKGRKRGNYVRKQIRKNKIAKIKENSQKLIKEISDKELWLVGISLYWAEGNKQRSKSQSGRVQFSNSDWKMIKIFITWLSKFENISADSLIYEIYIHETKKNEAEIIKRYWSKKIGVSTSLFDRIYLKKTKSKRTYHNETYHGLMRVTVRKSTDLNRKFSSLAEVICERCGIV